MERNRYPICHFLRGLLCATVSLFWLQLLVPGRVIARDDAQCDLAIEKAWEAGRTDLVLGFTEKCINKFPLDPSYHSMKSIAYLQKGDYLKSTVAAAVGYSFIRNCNKEFLSASSGGDDLGLLNYLISATQFRLRAQKIKTDKNFLPVEPIRQFVDDGKILAGCHDATPTKRFKNRDSRMEKDNADNACNEYLLFEAWDSFSNGDGKRGCMIMSSLDRLTRGKIESVPSPFFGFNATLMLKRCDLGGRPI